MSELKKLSEEFEKSKTEDENLKLAHRYMDMYVDSLVDETRARRENAFLIEKLDEMIGAMHEMQGELAEIRQQNSALNESIRYMDITRLTIGVREGRTQYSERDMDRLLKEIAPDQSEQTTEEAPSCIFADTDVEEAQPSAPVTVRLAEPPSEAEVPEPELYELPKEQPKKKMTAFTIASNIIFYLCMVMLIVGAVSFAQSDDTEKSLFGFRYYYIKTASMVPVYPVGSIVVTKVTPAEDIQVGDDVTLYVGDGQSDTYLTHRVVEVTTDQSGELAFRTKGVNNKANDPAPYSANLLVGKVVFSVPVLGTIMTFVRNQLLLVIGMFVLLLALSFMLRLLFSKDTEEGAEAAAAPKEKKEKRPRAGKRSAAKEKAAVADSAGSAKSIN